MKVCELFVGLDHAQRHWQFPCLAAAPPLGNAGQLTTEMLMLCESNPVAFKSSRIKSIQKSSLKVMPGHLAAVGGMRDRTDIDSSFTAVREVRFEENSKRRRSFDLVTCAVEICPSS